MPAAILIGLFLTFLPISLASIGSGYGIIGEVQRQAIDIHHWLTHDQFTDLFALSRLSPGPGSLFVAVIGWQVAGLAGALSASLGIFGPSSVLVYGVARLWTAYGGTRWLRIMHDGLRPVTCGMIVASSYLLLANLDGGWPARLIAVLATLSIMYTKINPLLLLPAGAGIFAVEHLLLG